MYNIFLISVSVSFLFLYSIIFKVYIAGLKNFNFVDPGYYKVIQDRNIFYAQIKVFSTGSETKVHKGTSIARATFQVTVLSFNMP